MSLNAPYSMSLCKLRILSRTLALACAFIGCVFAWQPGSLKKIYVEPFPQKAGSETLREDVVAQLRKVTTLSIVSDRAAADAILSGEGEIWIKGYQSLNPRSGRSPANGTPVYAGFLSVELKNTKGDTLWSYLFTPTSPSEDISKDLSKRIAKYLSEALEHGVEGQKSALAQTAILNGAGATFPFPIYAKWFANYSRENPNVKILYDSIGSEAGIRRLLDGGVDFGASDNPEILNQLAPADQDKFLLFPSVVGAVVPIVNLPGFASDISFTPEALAGIYMGKIKKWNDPILVRANRGTRLPDLDIVVVHRSDGSGTSYAWTDYLSKTSPEWKAQAGSGLTPNWPVGRAASGNDGVAKLVKELGGSIGYVEFIYALQNHLSFGKVRNKQGEFISASLESIPAAANSIEPRSDFKVSIVDAPGQGAYPIATFTWFVVPAHIENDAKRNAVVGFLKWMLGPGQRQAAALGYLSLPQGIVTREEAAIVRIH
jgi:phosphate transport system substrate-binding protein